jgi:hypothetical protein
VNNNMLAVPVADIPLAGAFAAAPGACLLTAMPVLLGTAELPLTARPRVIAGGLVQRRGQKSVQAQPITGQPGTSVKTYTHAMSAAANGGSQTGSLPAWDPV